MPPELIRIAGQENFLIGWNQDFGGATAGSHGILVERVNGFSGKALPERSSNWSGAGLRRTCRRNRRFRSLCREVFGGGLRFYLATPAREDEENNCGGSDGGKPEQRVCDACCLSGGRFPLQLCAKSGNERGWNFGVRRRTKAGVDGG